MNACKDKLPWCGQPHPPDTQNRGGQMPRRRESYSLKPAQAGVSYSRVVRWPGQEDPLVALVVSGIQPVKNITGHVILEEGQH